MKNGKKCNENRWNFHHFRWEIRENLSDERKAITEERKKVSAARKRVIEANKRLKEQMADQELDNWTPEASSQNVFADMINKDKKIVFLKVPELPEYPDNPWKPRGDKKTFTPEQFARRWLQASKKRDSDGKPASSMADVAKAFCLSKRQVKAWRTKINKSLKAGGSNKSLPELQELTDTQKNTASNQAASEFKGSLPDNVDDWGW